MSADSWTHLCCRDCWDLRHPDQEPHPVAGDDVAPCCYCGQPTGEGIYARGDPMLVHPKGGGHR